MTGIARRLDAVRHYLLHNVLLRFGLHRRIALFVSSILLAVFIAFGFLGWQAVARTTTDTLSARRLVAEAMAQHIDAVLDDAESHLSEVATVVGDASPSPTAGARAASVALDAAVPHARRYFSQLLLFDVAGQPLGGAPLAPPAQATVDLTRVIDDVRRTGRPAISDVVRLPVGGTLGLLFGVPVRSSEGVIGLLVAEMRLPHPSLSAIRTAFDTGRTGHMELVDRRGRVIVSAPPRPVGADGEHFDFYAGLLASGTGGVGRAQSHTGGTENDENWHIVAFAPLKAAPWGVALGQSETEALAASRELRDQALAVAGIALAVALCAAWLGTRSVVGPILALTRAGKRMATGDLSDPILVAQPDEIGSLADTLETMRQQLRASIIQINKSNQDLEQRVSERTYALETSNRHLRSLMAVATASGRCPDRESILKTALVELVAAVQAESAWAYLWDETRGELRLIVGHNLPGGINYHAACPRAGTCQQGQGCWTAPMRVGDNTFGVLALTTASGKQLSPDALALMQGIADEVAVALENARLAEERAQLEAARRMEVLRAELLASVSHELRTPLGFIKGYTTSLLRKAVTWDPDEQREFLEIIDEETDHLTELVDGLLDVARARAGRLQLRVDRLDLESLVRRSLERMDGSLAHRPVDVVAAEPLVTIGDPSRLQQVVVNLLQNAVKYSAEGTPIELRLEKTDECVRLTVLDRGVGLSTSDVTRIFEPFYRVQNGRAPHAGGAGLGLAICRAIVEEHGGRIWAEPRVDGGTAVHVELPATQTIQLEQVNAIGTHPGD